MHDGDGEGDGHACDVVVLFLFHCTEDPNHKTPLLRVSHAQEIEAE
jgi:hypothetical protein